MVPRAPIRSILVCSGIELLGDGVMKLPFLHALRAAWPHARITWLTISGPSVFSTVLAELVAPYLDEIVEETGIGARWSQVLSRPLPGRRFDLVLDAQRRFRTTMVLRRIEHGIFVSGTADFLLSDRKPPAGQRGGADSMVGAMLQLITVAGGKVPLVEYRLDLPERFVAAATVALPETGYVGFAPGAGGTHKCWPLENFLSVAAAIRSQGRRPVFLLGPAEAALAAPILAACPDAVLPLGIGGADPIRTSPLFTIACGRRLDAAVANDSGAGHLLAAAGVPLLSLFGPTKPAKFAPVVSRGTILQAQRFGGRSDMTAIPVTAVLDALGELLA